MSENLNGKSGQNTASVKKNDTEKNDTGEVAKETGETLQQSAKEPVIETKETISDADLKKDTVTDAEVKKETSGTPEIKKETVSTKDNEVKAEPCDSTDKRREETKDKPEAQVHSDAVSSHNAPLSEDNTQQVREQLDKELDATMDKAEELRKNEESPSKRAKEDMTKPLDKPQSLDDYNPQRQVVPVYQDNYQPQIRSLKNRVNFLTLLLIGVIAASGYGVYYFDKQKFGELTTVQASVEQAKNTILATESKVTDLYSKIKVKDESIQSYLAANADLKKYNDALLSHEQELTAKTEAMNQAVDKINIRLNNYEDRNPNDWLIAQSFFLVNNAQNIISYTDNMEAALLNLNNADLLLVKIDDPNVNQIREAISADILALKKVAHIDIRGINYKIDSLYNTVADMPLNEYLQKQNELRAGVQQASSDIKDWKSNVLNSLKEFSSRFVEIRRRGDAAVNQYLSPEQSSILLQNIKTELLLSKVALFNRDQADFRHNLQEIVKHINDYFDVSNLNVKSTLEVLDELLKCNIESQKPDYLSSFTLFNTFATEKFNLYKRQKMDAAAESDLSKDTSNTKSTNKAKEGSK